MITTKTEVSRDNAASQTQARVKAAREWTYRQLSDHINQTQSRLNSAILDGCDREIENLIRFRTRLFGILKLKNELFFEKKERMRLKRISDWHLTFGN
jgi:non-ribosomal peptide synthetase component E (peptide arylation enzyme)